MAPLKVLISGGGIAGPALAFWLTRLGCEVTVIERATSLRAQGQQIDIRGAGIAAMKRMGIEAAVRAACVTEPGTQFVDASGRRRAYFAANTSGKGRNSFTAEYEIMRGDMCRVLYEASIEGPNPAVYKFGKQVVGYAASGDQVRVALSDGKEVVIDLLVGAEGQNSKIRRLMTSQSGRKDGEDGFCPMGQYLAWASIPSEEGDTNVSTMYHTVNKRAISTRMDKPETLRIYLFASGTGMSEDHSIRTSLRGGSPQEQKKAWADYFVDAGWQSPRIMNALTTSPVANDWYACEVGQVKLDSWSHGRVVLLGDAAHCPSPFSGMGTASSLVGAYVLAGEIARQCNLSNDTRATTLENLPTALKAYEQTLRPYITEVQKLPWGVPDIMLPKSQLTISVAHAVLGMLTWLKIDQLINRLGTDDSGGWQLPEYLELELVA